MNGFEEAKQENRIVAGWLLYYEERKREYEQMQEQILHGGQHSGVVVAGAEGEISDSTGNRAVELADRLAEKKAWLDLVEEVEQKLPWKMQVFLRLRRECRHRRGPHAWVPYIQHKYAEEVARREKKQIYDVWIANRQTFYVWWQRIVDYAARQAARRNLI